MKEWKTSIAQAIIDDFKSDSIVDIPVIGETDRAVKFSDTAKKYGYDHINRTDIEDIAQQVIKLEPTLHPVRFVADPNRPKPTESLWNTLYFTDLSFNG